jgi:hypothetical protein
MNKSAIDKTRTAYWEYADKPASELRQEFIALLSQGHPEQVYQRYIELNTRLVPREFVQNHGIHFHLVLRKLSFGADYKSDFAYLSKSSDDWNCVLVEIERPDAKFFKGGTNEFHPAFNKALDQITSWKAWFSEEANKSHFANSTVGLIRVPLEYNPIHPKFILVYGRRTEYEKNRTRRRLIAAKEDDNFKILTFDSLVEDLQFKHDLYVGVRRNEFIDIISDVFLDEGMFASMEPEQIRIGSQLHASALAAKKEWCCYRAFGDLVMTSALAAVRQRPNETNKTYCDGDN